MNEIILSIIAVCTPGPRENQCVMWMAQCVVAAPVINGSAVENCAENLPEYLWPR